MIRKASAVWQGDLKGGKGTFSAATGIFKDVPYEFSTRFEEKPGTNPEELIAAAHAACFSMALASDLSKLNVTAERIETTAEVTLEPVEGKPTVTRSHLRTKARVPGITQAKFEEVATGTSQACPISRLLRAQITLEATLEG